MKKLNVFGSIIGISILTMSCVSSVSTSTVRKKGLTTEVKGREIIEKAWKTQGMDKLSAHKTYHVIATDKWKGALGKIAKLWPEAEAKIDLKYPTGTFDGHVKLLDGKREGDIAGLQSWKYYEHKKGEKLSFEKKEDKRFIFGINAYQYFFELLDRLKNAPLVAYAGEKKFKGNTYDLVLVTWEKLKAHKRHDQYTIWVNRATNQMEYCTFTIHDSYVPGGAMFPGSIEFTDFRDVNGISIPFLHYIYAGAPKEKQKKFLHRLTVHSFEFDAFDESLLYPNPALKRMGDNKL